MRFYVVSPLVARETSKDVEIGGYLLPKVLLCKDHLTHRMDQDVSTIVLTIYSVVSREHGFG